MKISVMGLGYVGAVSLACLVHCRAELTNTDGTDKSFPGFFEQAQRCGVVIY